MPSARLEEEGQEEAELRARYVETRARADRDRLEAREHAEAAIALGRWLLGEKRFDDALKPLKRARDMGDRETTFQPYFVEALLLVAETEMGRGQQVRARKTLEQVDLPLREMKATEQERSAMGTKLAAIREKLGKQEQATKAESPAERWRHAKLGTGVLVSRHDGKVRLLFEDGVERVFPADRVERVE